MAATDKTYRDQKALDIVFSVSCILMLVAVVWMFVQDYNREWKHVQREFRDVESALSQREMLAQLPDVSLVNQLQADLDTARSNYNEAQAKVAEVRGRLQAESDLLTSQYQNFKADKDALASYLNIDFEHLGEAEGDQVAVIQQKIDTKKQRLEELDQSLKETQAKIDENNLAIEKEITEPLAKTKAAFTRAEEELKRVTGTFDRFAKATAQKTWKFGDTFRTFPVIDAFQSPTRIQQITLPDLTIDYAFKQVPRADRCMTCHLAADRAMYQPEALAGLAYVPPGLKDKLKLARKILQKRIDSGESLGFDVDDLPERVEKVKLTSGQITQFKAHPRLDLFVGANSPHSSEKFGCTICHSGQGSATEFALASHTPNSTPQEHHWEEEYHWQSNHYWDYPMLPNRFVESSCLKCHHEVTDLIQYGSREEAPKLLEGYNTVKDVGCFGCHEISGTKDDRRIGPDLRLEPSPALSWLPPAEQETIKSDKQNPPGTLRKVGPSLRRISEKTNEKWTRQWLYSPRGFRPDTKMPHFYNLSTNDPTNTEELSKLPDSQKAFPAVEIYSMAHYIIEESKAHLKGEDATRVALLGHLEKLQAGLSPERAVLTPLQIADWKELVKATKSIRDLGLESNPANKDSLNDAHAAVNQAQELLQEYLKNIDTMQKRKAFLESKEDNDEYLENDELAFMEDVDSRIETAKGNLPELWKELQTTTKQLIDSGKAIPLATRLTDHTGASVELPEVDEAKKAEHLKNGRMLFQERGCLACHVHDATTEAADGVPAVDGDASFGPNLSEIAAKIKPEGDAKAGRMWLTQWIMNPNLHHPRTRMPITFLPVEEATAIADWLLSVGEQEYTKNDPDKPSRESIRTLARQHLATTPGMTAASVDEFLPKTGEVLGIPEKRMEHLPFDAEERRLQAPIPDDEVESRLMWYIGKKTMGRMGCFGCHDVSGFAGAKPIGTPLADWGKKDPERLAFEDITNYVDKHYNIVPARMTREDLTAKIAKLEGREKRLEQLSGDLARDGEEFMLGDDLHELQQLRVTGPLSDEEKKELAELKKLLAENPWQAKDGKQPYEKFYSELLHHHHREGFLEQKLRAPRSYDYGRLRNWDDRLRMPQFKFARRVPREEGEDDAAYEARKSKVEAEKREALMTFILGLTSEEVPLKYVYTPEPAKMAEIQGRKVLENFNCGGCHQLRSGVFELKKTAASLKYLEDSYRAPKDDYFFMGHDAWVGKSQAGRSTLLAHGTQPKLDNETSIKGDTLLLVRLTEALRFNNSAGVTHDLRAKDRVQMLNRDVVSRADPYGGVFADLLIDYLKTTKSSEVKSDDQARNMLPPPLIRQGERVQPNWLYRFLLDPYRIRPLVVLRMPKFNMSSDDSQAIVDYFSAVEKLQHPGGGADNSYAKVPQQDEAYWLRKNRNYIQRLSEEEVTARLEKMKPTFEIALQARVSDLKTKVSVAKAELTAAGADQKAPIEATVKGLEVELKSAEDQLSKKDFKEFEEEWKSKGAYASDAYRLLTTHVNGVCLSCHKAGNLGVAQAPPLDKVYDRLQPDWTTRWIAHPQRLFGYDAVMPVNFPRNQTQSQDLFKGTSLEQIKAIRDVLMNYPAIERMPLNRYYKAAASKPATAPMPAE